MAQYTEEQKKAVKESLLKLREEGESAEKLLIEESLKAVSLYPIGKIEGVRILLGYIDEQLKDLEK